MAVALSRAASPLDVVPFPTTAAAARREESEIELSVVVPTFNERSNVPELIRRLDVCLRHVAWEVIVVDDDSPDGTAEVVREIARRDRRVRCLRRLGRRGLASACIEGMLAGSGSYFAVLDGDLQHDETLLARMLDELRDGETDVVIGSRYLPGGGTGDAWDQRRAAISGLGARLGRLVLKASLSDPMSGFFMIRRGAFEEVVHRLSGLGFKILLDLFASSARPLRFKELPYRFRSRQAGESKLDGRVVWEYLMMLADKAFGHVVPARFVAFALVGGSGLAVHLLVLAGLFGGMRLDFTNSQSVATLAAMTSNFALNNVLTYRDMRLTGWRWLRGWVAFTLACGVGGLANVGIASYLFTAEVSWLLSALAGIVVGAVWNYAVTSVCIWRRPSSLRRGDRREKTAAPAGLL